ncbi:hypothetical protein TRICI_004589 [Trichomonascus ciferrii]|uniref:Phosphatidate cytidylyltransferase, mitochondrial n=1 Tax=Trichomonascus ciferrii TaxID=44093 RepID=A0A642V0Q6_9ASCO|nr:hypothetical protein TRICI_004589 [Trichomonascus ciferrii]
MITSVSYMGDPRMTFGENPRKIDNIVDNQFLNFRRLYAPLMDGLPNLELTANDKLSDVVLTQDMDPVKRGNMVVRLPASFKTKLYSRYATKYNLNPNDPHLKEALEKNTESIRPDPSIKMVCSDFDKSIASDSTLSTEVSNCIRSTVAWPSSAQTLKGILTAGIFRSIKYSSEKLKKYFAK